MQLFTCANRVDATISDSDVAHSVCECNLRIHDVASHTRVWDGNINLPHKAVSTIKRKDGVIPRGNYPPVADRGGMIVTAFDRQRIEPSEVSTATSPP